MQLGKECSHMIATGCGMFSYAPGYAMTSYHCNWLWNDIRSLQLVEECYSHSIAAGCGM